MSLYKEWKLIQKDQSSGPNFNPNFWEDYYQKEKEVYQDILKNNKQRIEGTVQEVINEFDLKPYEFLGFMDGISTSLNNDLGDLEQYELDTPVLLDIDFEKLLYNMHLYKASWLYTLDEWNNIFSEEKQKEIEDKYHYGRTVRKGKKIGRNEPCPCGSGKKYKKCCGRRA